MSKWINVNERLPERSQKVLVACYGLDSDRNTVATIQLVNYSARHKAFNASDDCDEARYAFDNVRYWMYAPKLPEVLK